MAVPFGGHVMGRAVACMSHEAGYVGGRALLDDGGLLAVAWWKPLSKAPP